MSFLKILLIGLAVTVLTACSKTVQWEEEVPLNTGETIWVKRSMPWVYKGGMGNPFDMSMKATFDQTISFQYAGKEYSFTGIPKVLWIAISPSKLPILVADPTFSGWNYLFESTYYCTVPYYVQFVPDETRKKWTWPEKIEPWLYNSPANLMVVIPNVDEDRKDRYTQKDRDERDASFRRISPSKARIDPSHDAKNDCPQKYDPSLKSTQTRSEK